MAEHTQQQLLELVNQSQVKPGNDRARQITERIQIRRRRAMRVWA